MPFDFEIGDAVKVVAEIVAIVVALLIFSRRRQDVENRKINKMATDIEVIKTQMLSALNIAGDQKSDHDEMVRSKVRIDENHRDIDAQHQKIRDIHDDIKVRLRAQDSKIEKFVSNH